MLRLDIPRTALITLLAVHVSGWRAVAAQGQGPCAAAIQTAFRDAASRRLALTQAAAQYVAPAADAIQNMSAADQAGDRLPSGLAGRFRVALVRELDTRALGAPSRSALSAAMALILAERGSPLPPGASEYAAALYRELDLEPAFLASVIGDPASSWRGRRLALAALPDSSRNTSSLDALRTALCLVVVRADAVAAILDTPSSTAPSVLGEDEFDVISEALVTLTDRGCRGGPGEEVRRLVASSPVVAPFAEDLRRRMCSRQ